MRTVQFEVPVDTTLFSPLQMQAGQVLSLGMRGWAEWLRRHLVSFPALLKEHGFGAVVAGFNIDYEEPLAFLDADALVVRTCLRVHRRRGLLEQHVEFLADGRRRVFARALLRPVQLDGGEAFAATPAALPDRLLALFADDEVSAERPRRGMSRLASAFHGNGGLLASGSYEFLLHRHHCETADQWSFAEIPRFAAAGREALILSSNGAGAVLRPGLGLPIRSIDFELKRPLFVFDRCTVETRAAHLDGRLAFLHEFRSRPGNRLHARGTERF